MKILHVSSSFVRTVGAGVVAAVMAYGSAFAATEAGSVLINTDYDGFCDEGGCLVFDAGKIDVSHSFPVSNSVIENLQSDTSVTLYIEDEALPVRLGEDPNFDADSGKARITKEFSVERPGVLTKYQITADLAWGKGQFAMRVRGQKLCIMVEGQTMLAAEDADTRAQKPVVNYSLLTTVIERGAFYFYEKLEVPARAAETSRIHSDVSGDISVSGGITRKGAGKVND